MAYATHNQLRSSRFIPEEGVTLDVSAAGIASSRTPFSGNDPGVFEVHHRITTTQKDALITDYATQRETTFSFTWKETNESFTVFYVQRPQPLQEGLDLWFVITHLAKVAVVGFILQETADAILQENADKLILEDV